jgi:hypothetical protein
MGMSIPTIIFGKNFSARSAFSEDWVVVPFTCEGEQIEVKFCLAPSRGARPAATSYALQGLAVRDPLPAGVSGKKE